MDSASEVRCGIAGVFAASLAILFGENGEGGASPNGASLPNVLNGVGCGAGLASSRCVNVLLCSSTSAFRALRLSISCWSCCICVRTVSE